MAEQKELSGVNRFEFKKELADTLQGRIYLGYDILTKKSCVIKEAWMHLVKTNKTRKGHNVPENFILERKMQMKLSSMNDCHKSIVRGLGEWDDEQCYYIAMEKCDTELFDYISNQHQSIYPQFIANEMKKVQICMNKPNNWLLLIQKLFSQIVYAVAWMHNKNICHLDLSLENTMMVKCSQKDNDFQCKIIDFGLCKQFNDNNFIIKGRVGKLQYMPPEAYQNDEYDARSADIYCLGVMLFMMLVGAPPYKTPSRSNPAFNFIISGKIPEVLKHWKRLRLVTQDALDVLCSIFQWEKKRITMDKLLKMPFILKEEISTNNNNNNDNNKNDHINENKNNDEQKNDDKMDIDKLKKMKKLAKSKLTDWGLEKYEINLRRYGYIKLASFRELSQNNGAKLIEIGFTNEDAQTFVKKYQDFIHIN